MPSQHRTVNAVLVLGLMLSGAGFHSLARAADAAVCPAEALESKAAGDQAMLTRDYSVALACYEAAYIYSPTPPLLYNRARASEMLGHTAEALSLLRTFQRAASPELQARVSGLDALIESLEGQVASLQVDCNVEGAEVRVEGALVGRAPLPVPIPVDVGSVQVEVRAPGYQPLSRKVSANAGARLVVVADLVPRAEAAHPTPLASSSPATESVDTTLAANAHPASTEEPAPAGATSRATNWPAWIALGVGTASAGVALFSFVKTSAAAQDVCDGRSVCTQSEHDASALDSYESWKGVYAGSAIVAGVGLALGGFLFWSSDDGSAEAALGPSSVSVRGHF